MFCFADVGPSATLHIIAARLTFILWFQVEIETQEESTTVHVCRLPGGGASMKCQG